jgi:hypothetical protein
MKNFKKIGQKMADVYNQKSSNFGTMQIRKPEIASFRPTLQDFARNDISSSGF